MLNYTIKQMMIAVGLAKGLTRIEICRVGGCDNSYITKSLKRDEFNYLIKKFKNLPEDKDTKEYKGISTLYMEIGRLLYTEGENRK